MNVTVSGGWWTGKPDERGIPHATMADGAPNGYSIITFDGQHYHLDFKAAGRSADYQMALQIPETVDPSVDSTVDVFVNVFNGAQDTRVKLFVDQTTPVDMTYAKQEDPAFVKLFESENAQRDQLILQGESPETLWRPLPRPGRSTHLWKQSLDVRQLSDGTHVARSKPLSTMGAPPVAIVCFEWNGSPAQTHRTRLAPSSEAPLPLRRWPCAVEECVVTRPRGTAERMMKGRMKAACRGTIPSVLAPASRESVRPTDCWLPLA